MSQNSERVAKFEVDATSLITGRTDSRIGTEIMKLRTWIVKHQEEPLPGNDQQRLWNTVRSYQQYAFSASCKDETVRNLVLELVDDMLKIPEGKLTNGKIKISALKLLECSKDPVIASGPISSKSDGLEQWQVIDCPAKDKLCLMRGEEVLEAATALNETLFELIFQAVQKDGICDVMVSPDGVVCSLCTLCE